MTPALFKKRLYPGEIVRVQSFFVWNPDLRSDALPKANKSMLLSDGRSLRTAPAMTAHHSLIMPSHPQ